MTEPSPQDSGGEALWRPSNSMVAEARLTRYQKWLEQERGLGFRDYQSLWQWSVDEIEPFWQSVVDFFEVALGGDAEVVLTSREMPGCHWFPGATLNYAAQALRAAGQLPVAVVAVGEAGQVREMSGQELTRMVAAVASGMRSLGVGSGDTVAAYLPNVLEALVACLATAALGAIWSSCSPDFGESAVLDRFSQIAPKLLIASDGYSYGGHTYDRRQVVAGLRRQLPSVEWTVTVATIGSWPTTADAGTISWEELGRRPAPLQVVPVPFEHPLWVLYSSGTTGLPKAIVQSHGGIVLEHLKVLGLHADLGPGDRSFWFTTTGWMMWNYLIGGLLVGATVVLYDGSPAYPGLERLWQLAQELSITHLGSSASHLSACAKQRLSPGSDFDLGTLRFLGSTGSPLAADTFRWAYAQVKRDLWLVSLSGGTDVCSAFVGGCPWLEVRAGVIQCRALGASVQSLDAQGRPVIDAVGELVVSEPMPSMPLRLYGDQDGSRLRQSYFEHFPGRWRHGDWISILPDGGVVIYGRSDSTINRRGVRIGTSEIYRVVEQLDEIEDSLVVDVERPGEDSYLPLFVVLSPGATLDRALVEKVRGRLRDRVSPRHVPDSVVAVPWIPRTLSGKKLEVPVKRILQGQPPEEVLDRDSIQQPQLLDSFIELALKRL